MKKQNTSACRGTDYRAMSVKTPGKTPVKAGKLRHIGPAKGGHWEVGGKSD
jgi:hypothetical protein